MKRLSLAILVFLSPSLVPAQAGAAPPSKKSKVPSSERVSFYATDGVSIVADYFAP